MCSMSKTSDYPFSSSRKTFLNKGFLKLFPCGFFFIICKLLNENSHLSCHGTVSCNLHLCHLWLSLNFQNIWQICPLGNVKPVN